MRRLPLAVLAVAALVTVALAPAPLRLCGDAPSLAAVRAAARVVAAVVPAALAQERLEFKPVPEESARALEERRQRRRAERDARAAARDARDARDATGAAPSVRIEVDTDPVPPEPPDPPEPPTRVELSRSGNIMRVGNDITIEADQTVAGDVLAVGGDVHVIGHVEGDVVSMGGDVRLESTARVGGDVVCMGGQLHEEDGAVVGGQRVTAARGRDADRRRTVAREDRDHDRGDGLFGALIWALLTLGVAWMFAAIAPGRTSAAAALVRSEPGAATVTGFLGLLLAGPLFLVIVILGALLCITIIGIPLALAAWIGYGLLLCLIWVWGYGVGAVVAGRGLLMRRGASPAAPAPPAEPSLVRSALFGVLLFSGAFVLSRFLKLVPGLGGFGTLLAVLSWIAVGVFTMVGAGALILAEWRTGRLLDRFRRRRAPAAPPAPPAQWYPAPAAGVPPAGPPPPPAPGAAPPTTPA